MRITFYPAVEILDGDLGRNEQMPAHLDKFPVHMCQIGEKFGQQIAHTHPTIEILLATVRTEFAGTGKFSPQFLHRDLGGFSATGSSDCSIKV